MPPLPTRAGPRPTTFPDMPHQQLDQQPTDLGIRQALAERVFALPGVSEAPSGISVPGARALVLDPSWDTGPDEAFFVGGEFAHLHPGPDYSLHLALPEWLATEACRTGWAEPHPAIAAGLLPPTIVMVYAPRNQHELEIVAGLVEASYRFATGHDDTLTDLVPPAVPTEGGSRP